MNKRKKRARADIRIRPKKPMRNWLDLPQDIWSMILMQLDATEILTNVQFVCSSWYNICKQPQFWHVIHMFNSRNNYFRETNDEYRRMLTCALHRSCGQAVHVTLSGFGTDPSLQYISLHSRQFRRLCVELFDFSMVDRPPVAENVEALSSSLNADNLKTVGLSCPLLKTLKLKKEFIVPSCYVIFCTRRSDQIGDRVEACDMEAFAIAKTMPNLCYLEIVGNTISDRGLHAILDGCPHLEYLDLTDCRNLKFTGHLRQTCAQRIKTLRLPDGI